MHVQLSQQHLAAAMLMIMVSVCKSKFIIMVSMLMIIMCPSLPAGSHRETPDTALSIRTLCTNLT